MTHAIFPYQPADPEAWVIDRVRRYGIDVIVEPDMDGPIAVDPKRAIIWVSHLELAALQWWTSRALALIEFGPDVVADFLPPRTSQVVVPLRRLA